MVKREREMEKYQCSALGGDIHKRGWSCWEGFLTGPKPLKKCADIEGGGEKKKKLRGMTRSGWDLQVAGTQIAPANHNKKLAAACGTENLVNEKGRNKKGK